MYLPFSIGGNSRIWTALAWPYTKYHNIYCLKMIGSCAENQSGQRSIVQNTAGGVDWLFIIIFSSELACVNYSPTRVCMFTLQTAHLKSFVDKIWRQILRTEKANKCLNKYPRLTLHYSYARLHAQALLCRHGIWTALTWPYSFIGWGTY
jgi:hypothetical protein